ncbi:MAG: helix-turn-helix domain-containing protein [Candidatus Woesearchaeota archaeon]
MDKQMGIQKKSWYFFRLQELVFDDKNLNKHSKLIYAVLSKYADYDTNVCYPSLKTISEKASCDKKTTIKYLKELERAGYIKKTKRKRKNESDTSNLYEIIDLGYISNAKNYAKRYKNKKLLNVINERLKKHPIPTEKEIDNLKYSLREYDKEGKKDNELEHLYEKGYR